MTKKQAETLKKGYSWLLKNYAELLEDMEILKSKELKKAEEDIKKFFRWEEACQSLCHSV